MIKDIVGLIEDAKKQIREQTDIAVIGLSGGADSTLVALLCSEALGKENVYGIHMPYNELDKTTFNNRSKLFAAHIGINNFTVDIGPAVDALKYNYAPFMTAGISTLNKGNMRSRMRMVALYTACCDVGEATGKRCRVVGTGNLSEDFISFFTKYADGGVDFSPIASLYKSEVYQLLDHYKSNNTILEDHIDRVPSAGLWDSHTDEGELGYTYNEMEKSIRKYQNGTWDYKNNAIDKFVIDRYLGGLHKNRTPPVFELRYYCD